MFRYFILVFAVISSSKVVHNAFSFKKLDLK